MNVIFLLACFSLGCGAAALIVHYLIIRVLVACRWLPARERAILRRYL